MFRVTDVSAVESANVAQLKAAVEQQPVAVGIAADRFWVGQYTGGILDSDECGTSLDDDRYTTLNHAALIVGWGKEGDQADDDELDYWLVKNSWGVNWGEEGYIRIAIKEGDGVCGIQLDPSYPTLKR